MAFIYDLTDTWNNAGTSFNGIKLNVTDTASAAGSKLVDVQIGGVSKFTVGKTGTVTATGIIQSTTGGFRFPDGTTQTTASLGGAGTVTSVTGTGTVSGLTLTGSITTSGSLTLGGTLALTSGNVTTALGFTPYNATNPAGYITASSLSPYLTSATAATTYQPLDGDLTAIAALAGTVGLVRKTAANTYSLDTATYLTGITSGQVTTALGYTPYNATNPAGYTANTGTVTSVGLIAGTGVSVSGGPITSSGSITVTNTAPDQVVSLTGGGATTVTGTYPNFTITTTGGGSGTVTSVAASGGTTGLTFTGSPVTTSGTLTLGGTLDLDNGGTGATDAPTARTNLGLGTAATTNASAYATAAQGARADTAVQTIASTDGSVTITGTTAIDLSVAIATSTSNVVLPVRNTTGATLTKGTAVYISGATGQISTVSKALATSDATSAQTLGLITADLANNTNGNVTLIGTITNINTSAYTDGAQLYLSPTTAGTLTATKPYAPQHLVYIATVEHAHPTQGKLFVKVQNGYEMDELHNVSAQSPANNDGLFYNTSTSLWEKKSIVTALGYTPYNATNPSNYLSTVSLTSNVTGTLPVANGGTGATTIGAARTSLSAAALGANTDITSIALTSGTITSVPTGGTDIVNKLYADSIAAGINFHQAVRLATTTTLPTYIYNNGASGVGATITGVANGALSIDGVTAVAGNRILVKNEATSANNGIYTVTQVGNGSTPYILTRSADYNSAGAGVNQIDSGDFFLVTAGTTQSNTSWVQQTPLPITVGTTGLVFTQFAAPVIYSAGTGLSLAGTVFSVTNTGLTASTYGSASSVPVVAFNAQGQATGVTNTSIAISGSQITSGTVAVANGGTGASNAATALTNLGAYPATNPSGYTTNVGTVTSVGGTGTVNGLTLTGTVTTTGSLTLGGTLSGISLTSQVAGTLPIANGGTGATTAANALNALGGYSASNPSGYTTNTGTVTSVGGTGTVRGLTLTGSVTTSGSLTLGGTLALTSGDVTTALGYTPSDNSNQDWGLITGSPDSYDDFGGLF
jgi:hypothetical protein